VAKGQLINIGTIKKNRKKKRIYFFSIPPHKFQSTNENNKKPAKKNHRLYNENIIFNFQKMKSCDSMNIVQSKWI